jgi:hypothetical protein
VTDNPHRPSQNDATDTGSRDMIDAVQTRLKALKQEDGLDPAEANAIFASVAELTVDHTPSWLDRLRELRTPTRVALAVTGALGLATLMALLMGMRTDVSGQAVIRYGLSMTAITGIIAATFAVSLRGAHQRPLGAAAWVVIGIALLVPLVLALTPWVWDTPVLANTHMHGMGAPCLVLGLVTGALTAAIAFVFQRQSWRVLWRAIAAVAGGGLTAFALLQLHCPSQDPTHLVVAHAGVGLMLAVVVGARLLLSRRAG